MSLFIKRDDYIVVCGMLFFKRGTTRIEEIDLSYDDKKGSVFYAKIPHGVTEIEDGAFSDLYNLRKVSFPKGLKTIGKYAFRGCSKLKKIKLTKGIELIDQSAFKNCYSLKRVSFPKGMRGIDRNAFVNCFNLKRVTIDGSFYEILGFGAFEGTSFLRNLRKESDMVILDGVLVDGAQCKGDVTIPDHVIEVAAGAFRNNQALTSIGIPKSVKLVSNSAFEGCIHLRKAVIEYTSGIAENLFRDCISLEDITFPERVGEVCRNAFTNTPWLKKQQQAGKMVVLDGFLIDGMGCKGDVRISGVKEIVAEAFMGNVDITSVVVEDGCEVIGERAFRKCRMLKSVQLPQHMRDLGKFIFSKCDNLEEFRVPEGIEAIRYSSFHSCLSLKKIEIPGSVKRIQDYAFEDCFSLDLQSLDHVEKGPSFMNRDLQNRRPACRSFSPSLSEWSSKGYNSREDIVEVVVPEGVTTIGKDFFRGCYSLKRVILPESLTKIEEEAFSNCSDLEYVNFPQGLKVIEESAFHGTDLKEVILPEGLHTLGPSAFGFCKSLVRVQLPESLTVIEGGVFASCGRLVSLRLPKHLTSIGDKALGNTGLVSIEIPDQVKEIKGGAFSECEDLQHVQLPSSLECLAPRLFSGCHKLTDVKLPDQLQEIGYMAFNRCTALEHLDLPTSLKLVESEAFESCGRLKRLKFGKGVKVGRDVYGEGFLTKHRSVLMVLMYVMGALAVIAALIGLFCLFFTFWTSVMIVLIILAVLLGIGFAYVAALGKAFAQG